MDGGIHASKSAVGTAEIIGREADGPVCATRVAGFSERRHSHQRSWMSYAGRGCV